MTDPLVSTWDRTPVFVRVRVATWEHAAIEPKTFGLARRLEDSPRLLPAALTAPIYAVMAEAIALVNRMTEPFPPSDARLLRTHDADPEQNSFELERQVAGLFERKFGEMVANWDTEVEKALGSEREQIRRSAAGPFCHAGPPRSDFTIGYGYRVQLDLISCAESDQLNTHSALVRGWIPNPYPPGEPRDAFDAVTTWPRCSAGRTSR